MTGMRAPGGRLANVMLGVYLTLFFGFLFLPIMMAVESSFNLDRFVGLPWKGFTLEWYQGILAAPDVLPSLRNSVAVGLCVATASVVLGFCAAYSLTRITFPGKDAYVMAVISPLAVPWVLLGLGFVIYFNSIGIPRSLVAVGISHTVFAAPLAMVMIRARLASIPPSYQEAARDLGASAARSIVEVVLPLAAPAIVAAFLVAFTLSFDEFILAWFVSGFETTLPVTIWAMIRTGLTPTVSAIGVLIFATSITLTILAELAMQRRADTGGGTT